MDLYFDLRAHLVKVLAFFLHYQFPLIFKEKNIFLKRKLESLRIPILYLFKLGGDTDLKQIDILNSVFSFQLFLSTSQEFSGSKKLFS